MSYGYSKLKFMLVYRVDQSHLTLIVATDKGIKVDNVVAGDKVPLGRPFPAQSLKNVVDLSLEDASPCVKVDDTWPGILEGHRAGMWTVALTCSGNYMGLSYKEFKALSDLELKEKRAHVERVFQKSKPHYLIGKIAELPRVIEDINRKMKKREVPQTL
ncbi:uncharacterized protein PRCAT00001452001 [Priceomyces carsonii]|uniref:uncharacterized protein n=1 Tax=Priceomyces carsonii TaxID=28549 RepID=UPI002ED92666|nr:unnamed protein product [Priceomyces carsonii]